MEEREGKRERRWAVSLQPIYAQEPRKIVRVISGSCINSGELNYYINGLRESYNKIIIASSWQYY